MKRLFFFAATILFTVSSFAQPVKTDHVTVELVSEVDAIVPGQPFWVGLRMEMAPHWHVYWRNPGDAGLPTSIDWRLPDGFVAGDLQWPYPMRVPFDQFMNFGYEDEVVLLVQITPPADLAVGSPVTLEATADWLVCKDVCIPEAAELALTLETTVGAPVIDEKWNAVFTETRALLPLPESDWQISAAVVDSTLLLQATPPAWFEGVLQSIQFFPYAEMVIQNGAAQVLSETEDGYRLSIPLIPDWDGTLDTLGGVLVSDLGWRGSGSEKALAFRTPIGDSLPGAAIGDRSGLNSLALALLFAFAGGLILNLMPCVLPVLSIKILGFVKQAGEDPTKSVHHGLVFTLGVLASFWVLAGALLLLRAGGEQLGWGFQLQSPLFVVILAVFLFLFGLSLFGVFEIGNSLMNVGQKSAGSGGYFGSFMSGVTATVVATPCTAPMMGSALGFALSQPALAAMAIFSSLGLGMAAPYLVLASSPRLLRFVPKPGLWMETLKEFMGFLLMATVIWLAWVLSIQTGAIGVLMLLVTLLFVGLGAWILGRWGSDLNRSTAIRRAGQAAAIAVIVAGTVFSIVSIDSAAAAAPAASTESVEGAIAWEPFSPEKVKTLRTEGRTVFVDFTAAWCLSCQVNKKVAFGSADVVAAFRDRNIAAIKADWTSRDETITRALAEFGRNSVPLYVLYPSDGGDPIVLPEILTPGIVLDAIAQLN